TGARRESSRDDGLMRVFIGVSGLYLVVALAVPLGLMLGKSLQGSKDEFVGLANYVRYFSTPALFQSIGNSLWVSILSTAITVPSAFAYAYALTRTRMPLRGLFKTIALVPILVPSLLPASAGPSDGRGRATASSARPSWCSRRSSPTSARRR